MHSKETKSRRFFYGYMIVAAGFIATGMLVGPFNTFTIFFKPLSAEFGWSRAVTSAAASIVALVMGTSGIVAGRMTDRFGPRIVISVCGVVFGLGYILLSQITALWQLYLVYGLFVGIGMASADIPIIATIARWFSRRRGMMTGLTKVGAGVGMMVVPIAVSWLIATYEWRTSFVIMGIAAMICVVAAAVLLKRDPSETGEHPNGDSDRVTMSVRTGSRHFSLKEATRSRQFWLFSTAWFSFAFCQMFIMLHIVPLSTDIGLTATQAAITVSIIGGFSMLGRFLLPTVGDNIGHKSAYVIAFVCLGTAIFWIQFASQPWMFYIFGAVYGFAHGACYGLLSPMVAGLFGLSSLGAIIGMVLFVGTFGGIISPVLAGRIFDTTGSYELAFIMGLVFVGVALTSLYLLKKTGPERADLPQSGMVAQKEE